MEQRTTSLTQGGGKAPVGFFAYPDLPATLLPPGCRVLELADHAHDLGGTLLALAAGLGIAPNGPSQPAALMQGDIGMPSGGLDADSISLVVARRLLEQAIICDESITSVGQLPRLAGGLVPHDHLALTGGAIGIGIPLATGAAIACPERKVIALQADGSAMFTLQGLWTQARENLDVVTVIYANRRYAILQGEMRRVGVVQMGQNADHMLRFDEPALDWCRMANGMGVEAGRATTVAEFDRLFAAALSRRGPFLIEAVF